jgi:hypothetical protein
MTTSTASLTAGSRPLAGWICAIGGAIGVASGLVTAFVTPDVDASMYRYPYSPGAYATIQFIFAANHLMLLVGVAGIGWARAARGALWATGAAISAFGLLLLTGCEFWALRLTNTTSTGPGAGALNTAYGVATLASGLGLVLVGIAVARARRWRGWARWTPLALGVLVFVVVLPGVFGTFLEGRLAISFWMVVWVALGAALVRDGNAAGTA